MDIKLEMMRLWKETFHDSEEYISLLFDNYFNPQNIACCVEDGKLKASLMAIPYNFRSIYGEIPAVYLCGLVTRPEYRRQGIMARLMEDILSRSKEGGKALAFLIPANEGLIRYYLDRGWSTAIYRVTEHYTELHKFVSDDEERVMTENYSFTRIEYLKKDLQSSGNIKISNLVTEYISKQESGNDYLTLIHDPEMVRVMIDENTSSNGQVWIATDKANEICGILFSVPVEQHQELDVRYLLCNDEHIGNMLLETLRRNNEGYSITLRRFPEQRHRKALWEPLYGASLPEVNTITGFGEAERVYDAATNAETYGMARILDMDCILKYLTVFNEKAKDNKIKEIRDTESLLKNLPHMTEQQVQSVILRHPHDNNMIGELFGLQRLPLNMALLLD